MLAQCQLTTARFGPAHPRKLFLLPHEASESCLYITIAALGWEWLTNCVTTTVVHVVERDRSDPVDINILGQLCLVLVIPHWVRNVRPYRIKRVRLVWGEVP